MPDRAGGTGWPGAWHTATALVTTVLVTTVLVGPDPYGIRTALVGRLPVGDRDRCRNTSRTLCVDCARLRHQRAVGQLA